MEAVQACPVINDNECLKMHLRHFFTIFGFFVRTKHTMVLVTFMDGGLGKAKVKIRTLKKSWQNPCTLFVWICTKHLNTSISAKTTPHLTGWWLTVSAAQSGSMFSLETTLQRLDWTFYLSVLNPAPVTATSPGQPSPAQPSPAPATQHELCPSYSLQVRRKEASNIYRYLQ